MAVWMAALLGNNVSDDARAVRALVHDIKLSRATEGCWDSDNLYMAAAIGWHISKPGDVVTCLRRCISSLCDSSALHSWLPDVAAVIKSTKI